MSEEEYFEAVDRFVNFMSVFMEEVGARVEKGAAFSEKEADYLINELETRSEAIGGHNNGQQSRGRDRN